MAVTIINQPMDYACPVGDTAIAYVDAEGTGLTYQWWVKNPQAENFNRSSITAPVYTVALTAANSGRQLYCVVSDGVDSVTSDTVTITEGTTPAIQKDVCHLRLARQQIADAIAENGGVVSYETKLAAMPSLISGLAIEHWDFTSDTPMVGTIRGWHNLTDKNITYDSSGAIFDDGGGYIKLPLALTPRTIELSIGSMDVSGKVYNQRFLDNGDNSPGLSYRYVSATKSEWGFYWGGAWQMTGETDPTFFSNSIITVYIDDDYVWHIYKNGVLWFEATSGSSLSTLYIGATQYPIVNTVIKSVTLK